MRENSLSCTYKLLLSLNQYLLFWWSTSTCVLHHIWLGPDQGKPRLSALLKAGQCEGKPSCCIIEDDLGSDTEDDSGDDLVIYLQTKQLRHDKYTRSLERTCYTGFRTQNRKTWSSARFPISSLTWGSAWFYPDPVLATNSKKKYTHYCLCKNNA